MVFLAAPIKKMLILIMLVVMIHPFALAAKTPKKHVVKKVHSTRVVKAHKKVIVKKPVPKKIKPKLIQKKKPQLKPVAKQKREPIVKPVAVQTIHPAARTSTQSIAHSLLPTYLLSSMEKNLVKFVRNTVDSINYTKYKLGGTRIEPKRGVYIVDCSSYVDHILKTVYPQAYSSLTRWSGSQKPTTHDFYQYFTNLSDDARHWNSIDDASDLRPGDILVFRNKSGGHVMIIMDMPERNGNTLMLQIADAAPSGHSMDTRQRHSSGIGIGTMLLKINPVTAQPYAYAWKVGAKWQSNVNFAMARPLDFS